VDRHYPEAYAIFIARDGQITAARYTEENSETAREIRPYELESMIKATNLLSNSGEDDLSKVLLPDLSDGTMYSLENNRIPMLQMTTLDENSVIGLFHPNASSIRVYEALNEMAAIEQEETAKLIGSIVYQYTAILVVFGLALILLIALLAHRLSKTIAEPVEQEKAMLEKANQMKTELLAKVSHEIKTPLTVISTHIQRAEAFHDHADSEGKKKLLESLSVAQDEIMLLSRLVSDALALSSLQATSHLEKSLLDIGDILCANAEAYGPILEKRGNTIALSLEDNLAPVLGNADALTQMMSNLVFNANILRTTSVSSLQIRICWSCGDLMFLLQ